MSEEEEIYEVAAVIGHRVYEGKIQYRLRWKSYADDEATWEFEDSMNCPKLVAEYHSRLDNDTYKFSSVGHKPSSITASIDVIRDKQPKMVVAAFLEREKLVYRVACSGDEYISVYAETLRMVCPGLICSFLENKITIK